MKKTALAIMAIVIGYSSMAQTADSTSFNHRKFHNNQRDHGKQNFEKLHLTNDQEAQIKTLNENLRQQMQDINKNTGISADELKEKRRNLVKEHKEKVYAILTPEQKKQAQEMKHDFADGDKGEMRSKRFGEMTKDLNLTPEQSTKMKAFDSALKNNIKSIRENTSLSQEEKKEQMKSLMKKHKDDMETLLTDEQKEQLKNNHKNRHIEAAK